MTLALAIFHAVLVVCLFILLATIPLSLYGLSFLIFEEIIFAIHIVGGILGTCLLISILYNVWFFEEFYEKD